MIMYSVPSMVISEPEYFPNSTLSFAFTVNLTSVPASDVLPGPTATTVPCWGFSWAVSGKMIPPEYTSYAGAASTKIRSDSGFILKAI